MTHHSYGTELATHPDVLEVSVVARPHAKWGERAMAFAILHGESAKRWEGRHTEFERELKQHARTRLPGFACPEWVQVVQELPVCGLPHVRRACTEPYTFSENLNRQDTESGSSQAGFKALILQYWCFLRTRIFVSRIVMSLTGLPVLT